MTWVLCILVPMVHTPRERSGATFVKVLAQSECGQFCHFGICGPNWDRHNATSPRHHTTYGMADPISKPAWRYTIGSTLIFGSFRAAKMTPFWDSNFNPPCGQLAAPYLYAHGEPGPNLKLYTQI